MTDEYDFRRTYGRATSRVSNRAKYAFLGIIRERGTFNLAAEAAGHRPTHIREELKNDPVFSEAYAEAQDVYRDHVEAEVHRRAIEGWDEPVYGNKGTEVVEGEVVHKGHGVVGHTRKYSDRMLELHAKRHITAYRDRIGIDADVNMGGVLAVAAIAATPEEWEARFGAVMHPKLPEKE